MACSKPQNMDDQHEYNYDKVMEEVLELRKTLTELKEDMIQKCAQVGMLEVDLATAFDPKMVETAKAAEESCKQCTTTVENIAKSCEEAGITRANHDAKGDTVKLLCEEMPSADEDSGPDEEMVQDDETGKKTEKVAETSKDEKREISQNEQ